MRRAGRCGFTLLELMVALTVSGIVVLAAHLSLSTITERWMRARGERRAALAAVAVRDQLAGWLRGANVDSLNARFTGRHEFAAGVPRDRLSFVTGDGGLLHPGPHRVQLMVGHGSSGQQQGLVALLTPVAGGAPGATDTLTLDPAVTGIELGYLVLGPRGGEWRTDWDSGELLPLAIRLQLSRLGAIVLNRTSGEDLPLAPLLTLPIIVPVGREER